MSSDLDGLGLFLGVNSWAYQTLHHLLGHTFLFGSLLTLASARWVGRRPGPLGLVFGAFLSHLIGDYFGSGPGWALWPLWPFSKAELMYTAAWDLFSWQNSLIGAAALATMIWIAMTCARTPLEFFHPGLERTVVDAMQLWFSRARCAVCASRASARCHGCRRPLCGAHTPARSWRHIACGVCAESP